MSWVKAISKLCAKAQADKLPEFKFPMPAIKHIKKLVSR